MPFLLRLILFLIPSPALLSHSASLPSESQPVQMVISERCISDPNTVEGQEVELTPGSPLVLTHRIRLVPSSASGPCCKAEYAALHERIEALEREVSELREKCGGPDGGCCTSQQSKGAGCTTDQCLNDCNDQGRCVDGKCVCFSGFSGPDCSAPDCPGGCSNKGKCVNGTCVCDPGSTGPDCSIKTCPKNCSSHGRCVKGRCVCDAGFTGPDCSNAQCPGNCNKKGRCVNGKCECNPGFTGPDCSERSCAGNCNNQGRCVNGKCVCEEGFTGADCSERSCPGNCNKKGRCVNGKCVCNPGYTSPDCSERSCPRNCNNNGKCVKGKCVCDAGFTGLDCSEPSCPGNCNKKGRCVNGKCVCDTGFTGADCSERSCPGDCNDRGQCVNGKCVCDAEFTGPDCSEQSCPGNCNDKGRCVNGECVCDTGFTGEDCSERSCPGNCNDNGRCVNGECVCDTGFTGADCSERSCPGNCNNKGRCVDGECVCNTGFTGEDCSERSCPGNCNNKGRCVDGECVCDTGFTGEDCSERSCPGNCNGKGRCVNGECVCDTGFTGEDCSERSCPGNCNNKGRCVNGKCVCDPGFTGPECLEKSCLNNCNNKGRCVNGKCVCNTGFTGQDCSERSCPGNCNNKGRCVNGKCVCEVGFTGQDCSTKTCPNNCSNKGRCVNGKCVCNPGLAEPDCSECKDGFTGSDCATALVAVSHFSARNITESSVTLFWTPSTLVRYSTYHITFTSEKESDQKITATVNGAMNSYTQVGLAPGQRYTVTIAGEKDGKMGAVSTTTFQTLISGPKHLQVVKTSTTSVIVQWEEAQGEIDRYILYVSPNQTDGSGKGSQEIRLPPGRDSAQIDGLEPGRLYDISVVAEIDGSRSLPATVQAIPGPEPPSNLTFSDITDSSLKVSWRRPKSKVSGFKVTYIHTKEEEPISVTVDSSSSSVSLTKLSPGSMYEVSVISLLGLDESDPVKDIIMTLPDPPKDLKAINITDTKALLLWRPALANVDQYNITYHPVLAPGSELNIKVSGNAVEQQLHGLKSSTEYSVTIVSQLGEHKSSTTHTSFTTSSGSPGKGEAPRDLRAKQVTARTAVLSWKPPATAVTSYKLTYFIKGGERKEVILNPGVEHKLNGLHPSSTYTALLQAERGGVYTAAISTEFSTGTLRYPYPTDCSQELLNGALSSGLVEIFPAGQQGQPVKVYCDMETDGGGWTVFQRRKDGKTNFFQSWDNYKDGFGDLEGEFWIGNEILHNLTTMTPMSMRVDLRAGDESVYAHYSTFSVDTVKKDYTLRVSGYSGTAGDSMTYHNMRPFSTHNRDPKPFITRCAVSYKGGWWYRNCHEANLNGLYDTHTHHQGVIWTAWKGKKFSIPFTEMKIRPASFKPQRQG